MLLVNVLQTCLMFTHSDCARLVMHCQEKGGLPANKGIELLSGLLWLQMHAGKTHEVLETFLRGVLPSRAGRACFYARPRPFSSVAYLKM